MWIPVTRAPPAGKGAVMSCTTPQAEVPQPSEPIAPAVPDAPISPAVPDPGTPADPQEPSTVPVPEEPATPAVPEPGPDTEPTPR